MSAIRFLVSFGNLVLSIILVSCAAAQHYYEPRDTLAAGELDLRIVQHGTDFNSRYESVKHIPLLNKKLGPNRAEVIIDKLGLGVRVFYVAGNPTLNSNEYLEAFVVCEDDSSRVPANEWYLMKPDRTLVSVYELGSPFVADDSLLRNKEGYFLIVADFEFHCNGTVTRLFNGKEVR